MKKIIFVFFGILIVFNCASTKNITNGNFSNEEIELIINGNKTSPMRVYKITNKSDSLLLRTKSTYIEPDLNNTIQQKFIDRLYATVRDSMSLGVGIAAPQVGILKNVIWVQRFDKESFPFEVYLNPKIIKYSQNTQTVKEGCLSIPNRADTLNSRSAIIKIEYDTRNAEHITETIEGFTSVIFQHEIDHLNGILYLDHLQKEVKDARN